MNSKGDLISREALKKAVINNFDNLQAYFPKDFIEEIDNAPTVELEKVKVGEIVKAYTKGFDTGVETVRTKGEWIDINKQGKTGDGRTFTFPITTCSVCKKSTGELYNFCPNCGADMKGGAV